MAPIAAPRIRLRYAATRVRRLRLAHRLTKAELARRAFLTPTEYSHFEPPAGRRTRQHVVVVPKPNAERLAIALGTTVDYIATGATNAAAVPPTHPSRGMLRELERERRAHASRIRQYEKRLGETMRERDALQHIVEAMSTMRQRDLDYLAETCRGVQDEDAAWEALGNTLAAVLRMRQGHPARPDPKRDAADADAEEDDDDDVDPCPKGDPDCETGDDGSCHDGCEAPRGPIADYFDTEGRR